MGRVAELIAIREYIPQGHREGRWWRQPDVLSLARGDPAYHTVRCALRRVQLDRGIQAEQMAGDGLNRLFIRLARMLHRQRTIVDTTRLRDR